MVQVGVGSDVAELAVVRVRDWQGVADLLQPVDDVASGGVFAGVGTADEVIGGVNEYLLLVLVDDVR